MAEFNPTPTPVQDPNWLGWSKSIQQPESSKASAYAIEAVSKPVVEGIETADKLLQFSATDAAERKGTAERDSYLADLKEVNDSIISNKQSATGQAPTPGQSGLDIMAGGDTPNTMPAAVKNLPARIQTLQGAREKGISETDYKGRVDALAKDLRAQYPGYRRYIDAELQKVTGVEGANSYIQSLTSDINNYMTKISAEREKLISVAQREENLGIQGVPDWIVRYRSGDPTATEGSLYSLIAGPKRIQSILATRKALYDIGEIDKKTEVENAEKDARMVTSGVINEDLNALFLKAGLGTKQGQRDFLSQLENADPKTRSVQAQQMGQEFYKVAAAAEQRMEYKLRQSYTPDGRSLYDVYGPDKSNALIKSQVEMYRSQGDFFFSEKYGAVFDAKNMAAAMQSDLGLQLMKDQTLGRYIMTAKALEKIDPELSRILVSNALKGNVPEALEAFIKNEHTNMATQPDADKGKITTIKSSVDKLKAAGVTSPRTFSELIGIVDQIPKNIATESKVKLFKAAYDPSNAGLIERIQREGTPDPVTGQPVKTGQYSIFKRMFSDDIAHEAWKLKGESWDNFKHLGETTFGNLFHREAVDLNNVHINPALRISWDNEHNRWGVDIGNEKNVNLKAGLSDENRLELRKHEDASNFTASITETEQTIKSVNRLNFGLSAISTIAKHSGGDVSTYLMNNLQVNGFDQSAMPKSVTRGMINAIRASKAEQEEKRKKYQAQ